MEWHYSRVTAQMQFDLDKAIRQNMQYPSLQTVKCGFKKNTRNKHFPNTTLYYFFFLTIYNFIENYSRTSSVFTARVRSTREGNIYTWECLSVHHWWGVPRPRSDGGEGTPSQVWWWRGGTPSRSDGGRYPIPGLMVGHYPIPGLMVGGTPGTPHPRPGLDGGGSTPGYPPTRSGWWGVPRVSPTMTGWGTTPPPWLDGVPPSHHDWMGYPPSHPQPA